jgi:hypothetical protein
MKMRRKNPLLLYQMGKVASRSVEASLRDILIDMPIIHFHYLTEESIAIAEDFYYEDAHGLNRHLKSDLPHDLFTSYFIRSYIGENQLINRRWKIITLVRDPVARNISGFFESIAFTIPDLYRRIESITTSELLDAFMKMIEHEVPLTWFDLELKPFFGIDVYSTPFPKGKGYKIYTDEMADMLLLRVEDLSKTFSVAISEFLGIDGVKLISANTAKEKGYYDLYKKFVDNVELPPSYLEKMYDSKFCQNFYTEEEIQKFYAKWRN